MSVKIRLRRMGGNRRAFYRLVVADSRSPRDGKFIAQVGYYDPLTEPATLNVDADRIREWLGRGAQPSDVVRRLLSQHGVLDGPARRPGTGARPKPKAEAAPAEAAAAAAAAPGAAAPEPAAPEAGPVQAAELSAAAGGEAEAKTEAPAAEEPAPEEAAAPEEESNG